MQHRTKQWCRYKTTHPVGYTVWWISRHIYRPIRNTTGPGNQTQNWTARSTTTNTPPQIIPNESSWAWRGTTIVGHPTCKGLDSPQHLAVQPSNIICQKKGRYNAHVHWLPFLKSKHSNRQVPVTANRRYTGQTARQYCLFKTWPGIRLPLGSNCPGPRAPYGLPEPFRSIWIYGAAFWAMQCTVNILTTNERNISQCIGQICHSVPRRYIGF